MALINEVELGSLLPKMGGKVPCPTPMSIRNVKRVSERVTVKGRLEVNQLINNHYYLKRKGMLSVNG